VIGVFSFRTDELDFGQQTDFRSSVFQLFRGSGALNRKDRDESLKYKLIKITSRFEQSSGILKSL
jgi:hypothetical protein